MSEMKEAVKEALREWNAEEQGASELQQLGYMGGGLSLRHQYSVGQAMEQRPEPKEFADLSFRERLETLTGYLGQLVILSKNGVRVENEINAVTRAVQKEMGISA